MIITHDNYLSHSGIPGQQWGKRRYQNYDGSLTPEGRIHYGVGQGRSEKEQKKYDKRKNDIDIRYGNSFLSKLVNGDNAAAAHIKKKATKARTKADIIKSKYGEESDKYRKANTKAVKKEAKSLGIDALRSKMKELELQNLDDGTYQSTYRKNLGKQLGELALSNLAGAAVASVTGYGFVAIPTKGPTSLTKDQQTSAEKYAQGVREDYLTKHGVPIKGKKVANVESGADFDGDTTSAYGISRNRKFQNKDGSLTPEGRIHYEKGREPKASDNNPAKRADDYVNKHNLENAKAVEVASESIHKENFRTSQTDEYRSKLASLRNKGDKKLQRLIEAKEKAEKEYLNIAEDDFTVHDDHYRNEQAKADLANNLASQELIKYVMSQK